MSDFIHLHNHSEFSLLDGMPTVEEYLIKVIQLGMPGFALTEHGNLRSLFQLYSKAKKGEFEYRGETYKFDAINPIIGCEFYLSMNKFNTKGLPQDFRDKLKRKYSNSAEYKKQVKHYEEKYKVRRYWHMLVFAKDMQGYENLLTLSYLSWKDGFYYKPRIDINLFKKYSKGLIATTSCIGGPIPNLLVKSISKEIKRNEADLLELEAMKYLKVLKKILKDDFYIEIQPHDIPEQVAANMMLIDLASQYDIKVIATNDCHYVSSSDAKAHEVMLAINTRSKMNSDADDRFRFHGTEFYMKNKKEMLNTFLKYHKNIDKRHILTALENTLEINEKCNVELKLDKKQGILPVFDIPEEYDSNSKYLIDLCKKGWKWRNMKEVVKGYSDDFNTPYKKAYSIYKNRLELELRRIIKLKFTVYFLILWDMVRFARKEDIGVGYGRGSSAASLVCFLLGITGMDPIRYDLLFDRFLSEFRMDYPDIDIDFEDKRRKEIFQYMFEKYGYENSCLVGTVNRMKGKQALQDVGRVYDVPMSETTEITKNIIIRPIGDARTSQTIEDSFGEFDANKKYDVKYPQVKPNAIALEGKAKSIGVHPAAVQMAPFQVYKLVPIEFRESNHFNRGKVPVTAIDWRECQDMGLIKIDILGLNTLTVLIECASLIKQNYGIDYDLENVNLEEKEVLAGFTRREFRGIFQFDSIGMVNTCEGFTFDSFEDVIALNALYRPGGLRSGQSKIYIGRKTGKVEIKSIHPIYDEITKGSYGTVVYQEQLMQVFMKVAGYQPSKADIVRKKVSKSTGNEDMWKEREDFLKGAKKNNVDKDTAEFLFRNMSFFGSYAFNKAHSSAYSAISYRCMKLKIEYPAEYMVALLNSEKDDDNILNFIKESRRIGIEVILPNINLSKEGWSIINKNKISIGLRFIKGIGENAAREISEHAPYENFTDFLSKVNRRIVNRGIIKPLAYVGAFKDFFPNQGALIHEDSIVRKKRNGDDEVITKQTWEWMLEANGLESTVQLIYRDACKVAEELDQEETERLVRSVSAIPTEKHLIEYYSFVDKYINKYNPGKLKKIEDITYKESNVIIKGLLVDITYASIGDYITDHPSDKGKKHIGWGRRCATINIDDGTGIIRCKVDHDIFPTFRGIVDLGQEVPVILKGRPFGTNKMILSDYMANLDEIRSVWKAHSSLKERIKNLDKFSKLFIKHPVEHYYGDRPEKVKLKNIRKKGIHRDVIAMVVQKMPKVKNKDGEEGYHYNLQIEDGTRTMFVQLLPKVSKMKGVRGYEDINSDDIELGMIIQFDLKIDRASPIFHNRFKRLKRVLKYIP